MPFTYLGVPLGLSKPKICHFLPLIHRIEKRLSCTSALLSQAGRLELVNSVFSALPTFLMCTLKIPVTTVKKIDSYRKHCLWRGNDVNSKKPALAAWSMITQTKKNGGLGVVRLETHNKAMLLKFLHAPWLLKNWLLLVEKLAYSCPRLQGTGCPNYRGWKNHSFLGRYVE
jgi:hypothetical protein